MIECPKCSTTYDNRLPIAPGYTFRCLECFHRFYRNHDNTRWFYVPPTVIMCVRCEHTSIQKVDNCGCRCHYIAEGGYKPDKGSGSCVG